MLNDRPTERDLNNRTVDSSLLNNQTVVHKSAAIVDAPLPAGTKVVLLHDWWAPILISKLPTTIGRASGDVMIPHSTVSSKHAVLHYTDNGFAIFDHASTNGTYVNGKRATGLCSIQDGDELRFGQITFRFSVEKETVDPEKTESIDKNAKTQGSPASTIPLTYLHAEVNGAESVFRLKSRITTVGRADADIVINDPSISKKHFQIIVSSESIALQDLGSANGTLINGMRITYTKIEPFMTFTAGVTRFRIGR